MIVRWTPADILAGVSDLEIYEDLRELSIPLYRHPGIHLKMLVFDSNWAFHSSGNITESGLGLAKNSNIEVGAQIRLVAEDWLQIQKLMSQTVRIDDSLYKQFSDYRDANLISEIPLPPLELAFPQDQDFSRLSLPACDSPQQFVELYLAPSTDQDLEDHLPPLIHDLALYDLEFGCGEAEILTQLRQNFRAHPFVVAIADFIRVNGSLRFGAINGWITDHCSDKPTPYRWELKEATHRLYNWLAHYYDEITWDRPRHAQVIYWKK